MQDDPDVVRAHALFRGIATPRHDVTEGRSAVIGRLTGETKRHGRGGGGKSARYAPRHDATGRDRVKEGRQSCLGAVLFSSSRYCWPRFDATVTT